MHRHTAWGQWAAQLVQCTGSLPGGSGQGNSYNALPHCMEVVGSGNRAMHCTHCLGSVGSGTHAIYFLTAWGRWAVELLHCTASLCRGSGQYDSCNALPYHLGAVGSGAPAMRGPTSWGNGESCPGGGHCLKRGTLAMQCYTA